MAVQERRFLQPELAGLPNTLAGWGGAIHGGFYNTQRAALLWRPSVRTGHRPGAAGAAAGLIRFILLAA